MLFRQVRLESFCSAARDTKINDLYTLTKWSCYISGRFCFKLCRQTRSSSLSHWLNPRSVSNTFLKFANAVKHCSNLFGLSVSLRILGSFYALSFRLELLANALSGNCKVPKLKIKTCK